LCVFVMFNATIYNDELNGRITLSGSSAAVMSVLWTAHRKIGVIVQIVYSISPYNGFFHANEVICIYELICFS
jgi:hypothetical protein